MSQRSESRHLTAPFRSKSSFWGPNRSRAGRGAYRVELYAVPVMRGARIHRTERTETDDDASGVRYGIFMTRQIKPTLLRPICHKHAFWSILAAVTTSATRHDLHLVYNRLAGTRGVRIRCGGTHGDHGKRLRGSTVSEKPVIDPKSCEMTVASLSNPV